MCLPSFGHKNTWINYPTMILKTTSDQRYIYRARFRYNT